MIDYVRLQKELIIPKNLFNNMLWHEGKTQNGAPFVWFHRRKVSVHYYFNTNHLLISGKLITLICDTEVSNFDDLYGDNRDAFIDDVNAELNCLFYKNIIDIRDFTTTRIDYCFNVETPFVEQYLEFLTTAFKRVNHGQKINHTELHRLSGSVYIKNAAEYEKNARYNYTLNVYNKLDRLRYERQRNIRVAEGDFLLAENLLRIEVQASHMFLKGICNHFNISRNFVDLFNYRIAIYAIETILKRVFMAEGSVDFYTYKEASKKFKPDSDARKMLYSAATNHSVTGKKYAYASRILRQAGVYPYCILPKNCVTPYLKNPVKLIEEKNRNLLNQQ